MTDRYILHGLKISYFTGKLESYFRIKGIPFDFVEMDTVDFRACAAHTGVLQMPQVECPDGTWLADTTAIIAKFEDQGSAPQLRPEAPAAAFISILLEDYFDEWLWRPALYYRWAFPEDAQLMSRRIAKTMLRDMRAPLPLRTLFIRARQQREFLKGDGVTRATAPLVEDLFLETLDALESIFSTRPFLMGMRPCEADFGLMGPFFRHFSIDPTPAAIMRERSPHTLAWVARMWATTPNDLAAAAPIVDVPGDLAPLLSHVRAEYLPYLASNAAACAQHLKQTGFASRGAEWRVPSAPYRASCLDRLRQSFQALSPADQDKVSNMLEGDVTVLRQEPAAPLPEPDGKPVDRLWRA